MVLPRILCRRKRTRTRSPRRLWLLTVATFVAVIASLLPGVANGRLAHAESAPTDDTHERDRPKLDPNNPHGAWAGYSIQPRDRSPSEPPPHTSGSVTGMDVSGHQGKVDWRKAWADGARFSYIKATEGTGYRSPAFRHQYTGAHKVGMMRGAYHFALPDRSSGAAQAHYFIANGGAWSPDGRTLPGALDIEYNPYGDKCYGLSPREISNWIADFSGTYHDRTGRYPAIYTTKDWWDQCTGKNTRFAKTNPLWVARFSDQVGTLPAGWKKHTIWQYSDRGKLPGDQNVFNGDAEKLSEFVKPASPDSTTEPDPLSFEPS